ncbi:MAG: hypothetical protein JSS27_18960 [Planctomycetes bacterium]|nr:hypothetical protein [Planctomycetota bacterium]
MTPGRTNPKSNHCRSAMGRVHRGMLLVSLSAVLVAMACAANAQNPAATHHGGTPANGLHYSSAALPPGAVGTGRLHRGGPVAGYFQPVAVTAEQAGVQIAPASQGAFMDSRPAPLEVGLLVGAVYRFRVTNIPDFVGQEVFPTIEVIDRLYAPIGAEKRFPIPIELTAEDLELAISGHFITRVIYVEDPTTALPMATHKDHPSWFDAGPGANPLLEADKLGRPVAILRLGGRLPDDRTGPDMMFLYNCPPFILINRGSLTTQPLDLAQPAANPSGVTPVAHQAPIQPSPAGPVATISDNLPRPMAPAQPVQQPATTTSQPASSATSTTPPTTRLLFRAP